MEETTVGLLLTASHVQTVNQALPKVSPKLSKDNEGGGKDNSPGNG